MTGYLVSDLTAGVANNIGGCNGYGSDCCGSNFCGNGCGDRCSNNCGGN